MKCCVPICKNDSRRSSKSQGITFHIFPVEPSLRTAWLKSLGKEGWEPKERSAVCSDHFLTEDLYETKSGLRKVKAGAVPSMLKDSPDTDFREPEWLEDEDKEPESEAKSEWKPESRPGRKPKSRLESENGLKVCRICLASDVKLYSFKGSNLMKAYETLTGIMLSAEVRLPQTLCSECGRRLMNCQQFVDKCARANALMTELFKKYETLTVERIKTINREKKCLMSPLSVKFFEPDYHDAYTEYDETHTNDHKTYEHAHTEIVDIPIKEEEENIFINDRNDVANDIDDVNNDIDYKMTDKDYSTDDSLPLEKCKTKKRKRKLDTVIRKTKLKTVEPKIDRRRKPLLNEDLNETLFTITDLTIEEQLADILKRRETANYKNAEFKCTKCFKGFLDEDAYNGHMSRHTDQCGEHECSICKTHFRHAHALRKHVTAHHTQRFSCKQCPYVTTHRQTARLHERWHKGTKYKCPHCSDVFVKFTTYMGHVRIKHPSDFVCELCGFCFVSVKGIQLHKKLKHRLDDVRIPEDAPFCELCNVRFISEDAYKQHVRVSARHSPQDKLSNPNKPKAKGRRVRAREMTDAPEDGDKRDGEFCRKAEGPIPCEQCGLQLEDSRAYHSHFRRAHPDKNRTNYPSMKSPCMCELCGRMFQSYALLKDHSWVHTGERPFACEACGKAFRMKQRLVAHRRVHSAQRTSYVCALCGKQFSTHSNRQRHMFIHTGLKPFKCEMCGKGFKHASEKRAHVTYVHLKKPWPKRARGKRTDAPAVPPPPVPGDLELAPPWPPCHPKAHDVGDMYSIR